MRIDLVHLVNPVEKAAAAPRLLFSARKGPFSGLTENPLKVSIVQKIHV
jgi:hypothetical protein